MKVRALRLRALLTAALFLLVVVVGATSPRWDRKGAARGADATRQVLLGLPLSAARGDGSPVVTLKSEDLRLVADGQPQQIVGFERQTDAPLQLAVMLDASASQEKILPEVKSAVQSFLSATVRPGKDSAAILSFTGSMTIEQGLTDDAALLRAAVESVKVKLPPGYAGGGIVVGRLPPRSATMPYATGIWDSLTLACDKVLAPAPSGARRAFILVTDGVDTSSNTKLSAAAERAIRAGAVVYSIGVGDKRDFDGVDKGELRKISERTGGRAFFPAKLGELSTIFAQMRQDLLSQYVVSFAPRALRGEGASHKLQIELVNPELRKQGIKLAYPQSFFVGDNTTSVKQ